MRRPPLQAEPREVPTAYIILFSFMSIDIVRPSKALISFCEVCYDAKRLWCGQRQELELRKQIIRVRTFLNDFSHIKDLDPIVSCHRSNVDTPIDDL